MQILVINGAGDLRSRLHTPSPGAAGAGNTKRCRAIDYHNLELNRSRRVTIIIPEVYPIHISVKLKLHLIAIQINLMRTSVIHLMESRFMIFFVFISETKVMIHEYMRKLLAKL